MPIWADLGGLFLDAPRNVTIPGLMPVMFMRLGSACWMALVSLLTPAAARTTIERFFLTIKPTPLPAT